MSIAKDRLINEYELTDELASVANDWFHVIQFAFKLSFNRLLLFHELSIEFHFNAGEL